MTEKNLRAWVACSVAFPAHSHTEPYRELTRPELIQDIGITRSSVTELLDLIDDAREHAQLDRAHEDEARVLLASLLDSAVVLDDARRRVIVEEGSEFWGLIAALAITIPTRPELPPAGTFPPKLLTPERRSSWWRTA